MKKQVFISVLIMIALFLIGCSNTSPLASLDLSSKSNVPTQESIENLLSSKEEPNFPTSDAFLDSELPDKSPIFTSNIFYTFRSIKDLHTYATTGSKNPDNYLFEPSVSWDIMMPLEILTTYGHYQPIEEFFDIDEETFDYVEVGFSFNDNNKIEFSYFFDTIIISIEHVNTKNILEHYVNRYDEKLSTDKVASFSSEHKMQNGHLLRKTTDCDILYLVENGVKKQAHILTGNTYIMITDSRYYDNESAIVKDYESFMTDPKNTCFAPLFSDDEKVFNSAIAKIAASK